MSKPIKIALTGGPCAGKTTCICHVREWLADHYSGGPVYVVPEAATLVFNGVGRSDDRTAVMQTGYSRQLAILRLQLALEDIFADVVDTGRAVVICDRGALDNKAYCTSDEWGAVLHDAGLDEGSLLERYDGVVHLVTSADGAAENYRLEGQRIEDPASAIRQDHEIQHAYLGHGHQRIVSCSPVFDEKMRRVISEVARLVGIPEPLEVERKFRVRFSGIPDGLSSQSLIRQTYLVCPDATPGSADSEERVRKRTSFISRGNSVGYTHTIKRRVGPGVREEHEETIDGKQYLKYLTRGDSRYHPVDKVRTCFLYNNRVLEHDHYLGNLDGLEILEVEVENLSDPVDFPSWVEVIEEVTNNPRYSNSQLSLNGIPR